MLDKYIEELLVREMEKSEIEYKRAQKLRHYLSKRNFDEFIGRIIREHDINYRDTCYKKNHEPHPNNKFELLLDLVEIEGEEIKEIDFKDTNFTNKVIKYENYYFQWIWGQGIRILIYDENHEKLLSI